MTREVRIGWRVLDAQPDSGSVTIVANTGEVVIPISTADPDPEIFVSVTPNGEVSQDSIRVVLDEAVAGSYQRATVSINSVASAPLTVSELCWTEEGRCVGSSFNAFKVCGNAEATPNNCDDIGALPTITFGDDQVYSVLFTPPEDLAVREVGRLRIMSNLRKFHE